MLTIYQLSKKYPLPKKLLSREKQQYKLALDKVSFDLVPGIYATAAKSVRHLYRQAVPFVYVRIERDKK